MAFFQGATNVQVYGGQFTEIKGNVRQTYNLQQNNLANSCNDYNGYYPHGGGRGGSGSGYSSYNQQGGLGWYSSDDGDDDDERGDNAYYGNPNYNRSPPRPSFSAHQFNGDRRWQGPGHSAQYTDNDIRSSPGPNPAGPGFPGANFGASNGGRGFSASAPPPPSFNNRNQGRKRKGQGKARSPGNVSFEEILRDGATHVEINDAHVAPGSDPVVSYSVEEPEASTSSEPSTTTADSSVTVSVAEEEDVVMGEAVAAESVAESSSVLSSGASSVSVTTPTDSVANQTSVGESSAPSDSDATLPAIDLEKMRRRIAGLDIDDNEPAPAEPKEKKARRWSLKPFGTLLRSTSNRSRANA